MQIYIDCKLDASTLITIVFISIYVKVSLNFIALSFNSRTF